MGDAWGGSSAVGGRNAVGNDIYRKNSGNRGTVCGVTANIRSVYRVEGIQREWTQEGCLVASRGDRESTSGHLGRSITGE